MFVVVLFLTSLITRSVLCSIVHMYLTAVSPQWLCMLTECSAEQRGILKDSFLLFREDFMCCCFNMCIYDLMLIVLSRLAPFSSCGTCSTTPSWPTNTGPSLLPLYSLLQGARAAVLTNSAAQSGTHGELKLPTKCKSLKTYWGPWDHFVKDRHLKDTIQRHLAILFMTKLTLKSLQLKAVYANSTS